MKINRLFTEQFKHMRSVIVLFTARSGKSEVCTQRRRNTPQQG